MCTGLCTGLSCVYTQLTPTFLCSDVITTIERTVQTTSIEESGPTGATDIADSLGQLFSLR